MSLLPARPPAARAHLAQRGFSIMELLVAMVIGLVLTLAVSTVLIRHEGQSRGTLAANDVNQTGAYAAYLLDNALRGAGSGFSSLPGATFGCRINAARNGSTWLPRPTPWPAPFGGFTQAVRVAPVVIGKGQSGAGSDVIAVMQGNSGLAESVIELAGTGVAASPLELQHTIGLRSNDLLLIADGRPECLLVQTTGIAAAAPGTPQFNAGVASVSLTGGTGTYHTTAGVGVNLSAFNPNAGGVAVALGNVPAAGTAPVNPPAFTLYGVGADRTLFALDLLGATGTVPMPLSEGVVELRALYGVDTSPTPDGVLDAWIDPGVAPWDTASLLDGSAVASANLQRIVAIRVGLVLRGTRADRAAVTPATLTLFADLDTALRQIVTIATDDQRYRHRVVEATVPLRNVLIGL